MATLRSPDWLATAELFSGRPDPVWPVPVAAAAELVSVWEQLDPTDLVAVAPPLGYRGCMLRAPDGRTWRAFGGVVEFTHHGQVESRADENRAFEGRLLDTAPPGLVPPLPG